MSFEELNTIKGDTRTPERNITLSEIAELEEPIKRILEQLRGRIEKAVYGLIIGDDASGRIPTRIIGGVIKHIAKERKKHDKNFRDPNIIFIPGSIFRPKLEELRRYIKKYDVQKPDKILIVTDTIKSGISLSVISDLLKKLGLEVHIATIGIEEPDSFLLQRLREENLEGSHIISGNYVRAQGYIGLPHTPLIYDNRSISGVYKNKGDFKSRPIKHEVDLLGEKSPREQAYTQKIINQSREEANVLVDKLVAWYESDDKEKS